MSKNLYDLLKVYPDWAVGTRVTRNLWNRYTEPSFWKITRVTSPAATSRTRTRFRVWGVLTFRGKTEEEEKQLTPIWKRGWAQVDIPPPPALFTGIRMKAGYREPIVKPPPKAPKATPEEASSEAAKTESA